MKRRSTTAAAGRGGVETLEGRRMLTGAVDVVLSNLSAGDMAAGSWGEVRYSYSIVGEAGARAKVRLALSTDDVAGNADDVPLTGDGTGLGRAEADNVISLFMLPEDLTPGTYRVVAVVDPSGELAESDEGNNVVLGPRVTVAPAPPRDLTLEGASLAGIRVGASPGAGGLGAGWEVKPKVKALIDGGFDRTVTVRYALSQDSVAGNGDDVVLGEAEVRATRTGDVQPSLPWAEQPYFALPEGLGAGTYHLVATVDPHNVVTESDEANNTLVSPMKFVIPAAVEPGLSGLSVDDAAAGLTAGRLATVRFSFSAGEAGQPVTGGSGKYVKVRLAFSSDDVAGNGDDVRWSDCLLPMSHRGEIAFSLVIPESLAAGHYRVVAVADPDGELGEPIAGNAAAVGPAVSVAAAGPVDLTLENVTLPWNAPAAYEAGSRIRASVMARVTGGYSRYVNVRYLLSADDVAGNGDDVVLGTAKAWAQTDLAGDPSPVPMMAIPDFALPAGLAAGRYRLLAVVDAEGLKIESDETNNAVLGPVIWIKAAGAGGEEEDAEETVEIPPPGHKEGPFAEGNPPAQTGGGTTVKFYVSADPLLSRGDRLFSTQTIVEDLRPAVVRSKAIAAGLTRTARAGSYYVIAQPEQGKAVAVRVDGRGAKLTATAVGTKPAKSGNGVRLSVLVKNAGSEASSGKRTLRVLDGRGNVVKEVERTLAIGAGKAKTLELNVAKRGAYTVEVV